MVRTGFSIRIVEANETVCCFMLRCQMSMTSGSNPIGFLMTQTEKYATTRLICGKKVAIAYRPEALARAAYRRELRRLKEHMPKEYADKFMLVTDRSFTREQAYNADLFHAFTKFPDPEADGALQAILRMPIGHVSITSLCKLIGLVGRSFAAVIRAVFQGYLRQASQGYLEVNSVVARGATS